MTASLFPTDAEIEQLLVGPGSVTWRFASDVRLYAGMLYPLLLQVAHPTVGAGVRDFSDFETRPWDRLIRTIDYVNLLVYGGADAAPAGRRLRSMHKGFQGTREDGQPYYALEPRAYAWVHATLLDSYVAGHAHFGRPMDPTERQTFYGEYCNLGRLIGVREGALPEDWAAFRQYFSDTIRTELERTESVDRVLSSVSGAARPPIPIPGMVWRAARLPTAGVLWLAGIGLLDPELRDRLGIRWTRADETAFRTLGRISRGLGPVLPRRLTVTGPAQLRWRREAIARGPLGTDASTAAGARAATPAAA